jgi:isopentenyl diphosphate isomerase/L-lactate dehydrogenase-like FMN-dependent dehydrogenase
MRTDTVMLVLFLPILYGLAAGGKDSVAGIINRITHELNRIMSKVGAPQIDSISREVLIPD